MAQVFGLNFHWSFFNVSIICMLYSKREIAIHTNWKANCVKKTALWRTSDFKRMYVLGQHLIKIIVINHFCSSATNFCVIFLENGWHVWRCEGILWRLLIAPATSSSFCRAANYYEKFVIVTNFRPHYEITNAPGRITNLSANRHAHIEYTHRTHTLYIAL